MSDNQTVKANSDILDRYAKATKTLVVSSSRHLRAKDSVLPLMLDWCRKRKNIVVLNCGIILTSNPTSRDIQNCKATLISLGIPPGRVYAATQNMISILLENETGLSKTKNENKNDTKITDRQKHLRNLVLEAIERDVSDIHIEVRADKTKIRMRQHGELNLHTEWSQQLGREIAAVAFNKETDHATSHFNPLIPQDASMPLKAGGRNIRLRLASVPAHGGFDMVMRILTDGTETRIPLLSELGYTKGQEQLIADAVKEPHGAIIVAGPTGSGKTTTLYAGLTLLNHASRNILTVEDPVEQRIHGIGQIQVNSKIGLTFSSGLRAILRQDPDTIMIGEIRDLETAEIAINSSLTGHLVLTTLHTNDAPGSIIRMIDMGIEACPGL